ncbi:MAG: HAMP domain-containing protein, partial [bacterium]|nr:HAMP domain-containing protein [bacterium]
AKTQKVCTDLRVAVGTLGIYGRQLLLVSEQDNITSIKANNIAQAARLIETSLETLREGVAGSTELNEIVQKIAQDFSSLETILTEADDSIAALRSQWLVEQENQKLLRTSLNESVDSITASLDNLQLLSEDGRKLIEKEAAQVRKTAERMIGLVGIIAVSFMVVTGMLIVRRIIIPINKAVSFAYTVSKGDFTADIDIEQKDEIGILVNALKEMRDKIRNVLNETDGLIRAVQEGRLETRGNAEAFSGGW